MPEPHPQLPVAMLNGMSDPFVCLDQEGRMVYINRPAVELLGVSFETAMGRSMWDFLPPPMAARFRAAVQQVILSGEPARLEDIAPITGRYFETMLTRVEGGVSMLSRDIHEQKQLAERLAEHEERLRLAIEAAAIGTWDLDLTQRRLSVSARVCEMFGRNESELAAPPETLLAMVHADDRATVQQNIDHAALRAGVFRFECRILQPTGEPRWLVVCGRVQRDGDGNPRRIIGTVTDESESRRANLELQTAVKRLQLAQQAARLGTFEFNFKTGENRWSPEMQRLYGIAPGTFEGTADAWHRRLHPADLPRALAATEQAVASGEFRADFRAVLPDDSIRYLRCLGTVFFDEQHRPDRMIGVNIDLTDRRESEARLAAVVNSVGDHLATYDRQWRCTFISERGARLLGKPIDELIGRCIWDVFPDAVGNQYYRELHKAFTEQQAFRSEHFVERWNKWMENHYYPTADGVTVFSVDVTARHVAEEALAKREAEFRSIFELAAVGASHAEVPSGRLLRVNARLCEITGYPEAELLGKTVLEITHPEDRALDQALRQQAIGSGADQWTVEKRFVRKDGSFAWVVVSARVLRDAHGKPISTFAHLLDITHRKAADAELESARRALREHAKRLETAVAERTHELREKVGELETFSYSASHDLRSPLRALAGYAQVLQEEYGRQLDDTARHYLERLTKAASRLDLLVQDMLAYSRLAQERLVLEPLSLDEAVRDVIDQYNVAASGAMIEIQPSLPRVIGHAAALSQSIANLLSNAVKFTRPGEVARIVIWGERRERGRVRLLIKDHGIGIAPRYHRQIFRIFERVHTEGFEGTGIGLAIVDKAVQRMKGSVGVESEEGHGATFWIELPAA